MKEVEKHKMDPIENKIWPDGLNHRTNGNLVDPNDQQVVSGVNTVH